MQLDGIHHVTAITGEAQPNVDFYAGVLGLRLVKKTVNQDSPTVYHLFYADEKGDPGSDITFFEYPGIGPGRAGDGMVHRILWRVASADSLDFWARRLGEHGIETAELDGGRLRFSDPEGLEHELLVPDTDDEPMTAEHPEIPAEHAIAGLEGARAYAAFAPVEESLYTDVLGFTHLGDGEYVLEGGARRFRWGLDPARAHGAQGAGSVHHIAWASPDEDHLAWQERVRAAGGHVTDVRDRDYFKSIYFREPRGVLFEIATLSPGFAVDEDPAHLGEELRLPRMHEHLRAQLEQILTPVANPRVTA